MKTSAARLLALASISCLSLAGCGGEVVVAPINTFCTDVPPVPHFGEVERATFRADPATWAPHVDWTLLVDRARRRQCNPPAGGPR